MEILVQIEILQDEMNTFPFRKEITIIFLPFGSIDISPFTNYILINVLYACTYRVPLQYLYAQGAKLIIKSIALTLVEIILLPSLPIYLIPYYKSCYTHNTVY